MKKNRSLLFAVIGISLLLPASCKKDNIPSSSSSAPPYLEYIVFGHFYGECGGEQCIEMFRLEKGHLYEDWKDQYPDMAYPFDGDYLLQSGKKYLLVRDFESKIPEPLLHETNSVIGHPDAGDGGGIHIETSIKGMKKYWYISIDENDHPAYLHTFVEQVLEYTGKLK